MNYLLQQLKLYYEFFKLCTWYGLFERSRLFFAILAWLYDLSIVPSYSNFKAYLGESWPYMQVVTDAKCDTQLVDNKCCAIMSSYSYLGNHQNEDTQHSATLAAINYGTGYHGPRMLLGNTDISADLERSLATVFNKERCIIANSGYMACMSALTVIASSSDAIYYDSRCHSSLRSGMKLSNATLFKFPHNDFSALEQLLKWTSWRHTKKILVIESLYSMDGTIPDLHFVAKLKEKYNLCVVIDEAHGLGTLGPNGNGLEAQENVFISDVIVGTFSKSLSNLGGYICGTHDFITECEYYSLANVFTAGLSAYHIMGAYSGLQTMNDCVTLELLRENCWYLRNKLNILSTELKEIFIVGGEDNSVVIPVIYKYDVLYLVDIAAYMKSHGFALSVVLPPACSAKWPRFRITATSWYSTETIDRFINTFKDAHFSVKSKLNIEKLKILQKFM